MAIWEGLRTPPKCQFLKYPALKGRVSAEGRMKYVFSDITPLYHSDFDYHDR